jgi:hypothetical protein
MDFYDGFKKDMKVGDLVCVHPTAHREECWVDIRSTKICDGGGVECRGTKVGIIIDFIVEYNTHGEAIDKIAIVNWNDSNSCEEEWMENLEVVNESR